MLRERRHGDGRRGWIAHHQRPRERSDGTAGSIHLSAGQSVTVGSANLDARGSTGGTITIDGEGVSVGATLSAEGTQSGIAGALRFHASNGDLFLAGGFHANAKGRSFQPGHGGIIEGTATGNVTASGNFRCAPDGCIAFSAGGTLDTSNADFDKPLVADCPG